MLDENKNWSLVLDFRKWWRHVKTIYSCWTHRECAKVSDDTWRNHDVTNNVHNLTIHRQHWLMPADFLVTEATNQLYENR